VRAGYSREMVSDRYGSKEALIEALFETERSRA
jgi:AcrR family transcriptional regulator